MRSRPSLRKNRRGYTLTEVILAASMLTAVLAATVGVLIMTGRMTLSTRLRAEAGQQATNAMQNMVLDVREAAEVQTPASYQLRIYYPVVAANGYYDKTRVDRTTYIEYIRADSTGTLSATGAYIYRRTQAGTGRRLCSDVTNFTATVLTTTTARVSLDVTKTSGARSSTVNLDQKVVFLRNHNI